MHLAKSTSIVGRLLHITYRSARRIVVGVIGATILLIGVAMLVLPGPAVVVIPAGLAILAAEFAFARRWLRFLRRQTRNGLHSIGLADSPALRRAHRIRRRAENSEKRDPGQSLRQRSPTARH